MNSHWSREKFKCKMFLLFFEHCKSLVYLQYVWFRTFTAVFSNPLQKPTWDKHPRDESVIQLWRARFTLIVVFGSQEGFLKFEIKAASIYWGIYARLIVLRYAKRSLLNVLSRCHTFFWYDTYFLDFFGKNFSEIFLRFFFFFFEKSVSYQKKGVRGLARPSFFWYDYDSGH